jgi:hypothetical protein
VKIALTFSEPPTITAWCALVAAIANVYPDAVLIEPILAVGARPGLLTTNIETGAMRAPTSFQGCDLLHVGEEEL